MKRTKVVLLVLSIILCGSFALADTINIPGDQPTIQAGIDVSNDGDVVLVQPGTYVENIVYNGKAITVGSLFLTTQDTSYISTTIIDGDSTDSVVKFMNNEDSLSVLIGFTITNGYSSWGGGIYIGDSSGMGHQSPKLHYLKIIENNAVRGGGIFIQSYGDIIQIKNSIIECNISSNNGGGIYCDTGNFLIEDVIIYNNHSGSEGGGIFNQGGDEQFLNRVVVSNNSGYYGGGGLGFRYQNTDFNNVLIANNVGGGLLCSWEGNCNLANVTISGNENSDYYPGAGISVHHSAEVNCMNTIIWDNFDINIYLSGQNDSITIAYSDIEGGESGINNNGGTLNWLEGNIDSDPLFLETIDYHLSDSSPCIDSGNPEIIYNDIEDPNNPGNAKYPSLGSTINDMGVYGGPNAIDFPQYVSIDDEVIIKPRLILLHQNYPNPFDPTTTFSFSIKNKSKIEFSIYNIKGQKVKSLINNEIAKGNHSIRWDGVDDNGNLISSGIYLFKLNVNGKTEDIKKCILMK